MCYIEESGFQHVGNLSSHAVSLADDQGSAAPAVCLHHKAIHVRNEASFLAG